MKKHSKRISGDCSRHCEEQATWQSHASLRHCEAGVFCQPWQSILLNLLKTGSPREAKSASLAMTMVGMTRHGFAITGVELKK